MAEGELDAEMVAIAKAIIAQRTGSFDPTSYRDRYQEALRELIEAKMKGLPVKAKEIAAPPPVIDLMAALKRSLAREASGSKHTAAAPEKGEQDGTRSAPVGSLAACPRGSETESTGRSRAHHSCSKAAQAGLMPIGRRSECESDHLSAMAMCAMTSSCTVAIEWVRRGWASADPNLKSPSRAASQRYAQVTTSCIHISAREPAWFSLSSAAPRTTPPSRAGARFEQVVACCTGRRLLLAGGRVRRGPNLSCAG
jgi:hypothetical protein